VPASPAVTGTAIASSIGAIDPVNLSLDDYARRGDIVRKLFRSRPPRVSGPRTRDAYQRGDSSIILLCSYIEEVNPEYTVVHGYSKGS
jgi:hypothetical protein